LIYETTDKRDRGIVSVYYGKTSYNGSMAKVIAVTVVVVVVVIII
jgi:hypothetical protein